MGRKRKCSFDSFVPLDSSDFSFEEDELAVEVVRLRRALSNMKSFAHS